MSYIVGMSLTPFPADLTPFPTDQLRNLRESRGMTRTELAAKLGVVERTIERWEGGKCVPRRREQRALHVEFPQANGKRRAR